MNRILSILGLFIICGNLLGQEARGIIVPLSAPSLKNNLIGESTTQNIGVCLPPYYDFSSKKYPVVYFLGGYGDDVNYWMKTVNMPKVLNNLVLKGTIDEMIIVVITGKTFLGGSFYVNSPVSGNWEDFVTSDVVNYIDNNYRTLTAKESRAISGHSMGGFGALNISMKHPELFSSVYAISPGLFDKDGLAQCQIFKSESFIKTFIAKEKEFDAMSANEALTSFKAYALKTNDFDLQFTYAYGMAFSPDTNKKAPFTNYPYTLNNASLVKNNAYWENYDNGFGNLAEKIHSYKDNLKGLKGLYIDYGTKDEYAWITKGSEYYCKILTDSGINNVKVPYVGGHWVPERLSGFALPALDKLLQKADPIVPQNTETRILVPEEQTSIQKAVNIAKNGDTIIVAPGTYYENINLKGKKITVASYYILDPSLYYISKTIIDASKPVYADTASCIIAISGEDTTTVIQGFTLTGGSGTRLYWPVDKSFYRQGGAIAITNSSGLTIKNNLLINNSAKNLTNVVAAGGGAISAEYLSYIKVYNNTFVKNFGLLYGGAISLCQSGADIRNNIIASNKGGADLGGGAILISEKGPKPIWIINNTIVGNEATTAKMADGGKGGAISCLYSGTSKNVLWNNIIWGNVQYAGKQINMEQSAGFEIRNNSIDGGLVGTENISVYPEFQNDQLYLSALSPCIDKGIDSDAFKDALSDVVGKPQYPAQGALRNDLGAYGGPFVCPLPGIKYHETSLKKNIKLKEISIGDSVVFYIEVANCSFSPLGIYSIGIGDIYSQSLYPDTSMPIKIAPFAKGSLKFKFKPNEAGFFNDSIIVWHNNSFTGGKVSVFIEASSKTGTYISKNEADATFTLNPNPCNSHIRVSTNSKSIATIELVSVTGGVLKSLTLDNQAAAEISTSALKPGMYFCVFKTADKQIVQKIIKTE